jgi:5-methylcytosine-specific restriction endonuclease McrA
MPNEYRGYVQGRGDTRWYKLSARLKKELPPYCWICSEEIDLTLHHTHKKSWTLDHMVPLSKGGDPYDENNLRPAHRDCNSRRGTGDRPEGTPRKRGPKPKQSRVW